jgi:hypothetical protein
MDPAMVSLATQRRASLAAGERKARNKKYRTHLENILSTIKLSQSPGKDCNLAVFSQYRLPGHDYLGF